MKKVKYILGWATLLILIAWLFFSFVKKPGLSTSVLKLRFQENSIGFKVFYNDQLVVQVQPCVFIDGGKQSFLPSNERDASYNGMAKLPGEKSVGINVSYDRLKDGIHVHYTMTPLNDVAVVQANTEAAYEYEDWINTNYKLGQQTGIIPEVRDNKYFIGETDASLITLGPSRGLNSLNVTLETTNELHAQLRDYRNWWPKLVTILNHGESTKKEWNWKKGDTKVFDFILKFNRYLTFEENNEHKDFEDLKQQIDALIKPIIRDGSVPCMVIGLHYKGETRVFGYGKTDLDNGHPPDGNTVFEVGSVTKLFTKLLLSDMVEKKQVGLNDPAQKYLPRNIKLPTKGGKQITLGHLAEHLSGLDYYPADMGLDKDPCAFCHYSLSRFYHYLSSYVLPFVPGEHFKYSNTGVALLGTVLSLKSGMSYETYLQKRILGPLGMGNTGITWTESQTTKAATPYKDKKKIDKDNWNEPTFAGSIGLHSSANDLLKLAQAAMDRNNPVLGNIVFGETAKRLELGGENVQYNGNINGGNSYFYLERKKKLALVALTNDGSSTAPGKAVEKIGYMLYGIDTEALVDPGPVEVAPSLLRPYIGRYQMEEDTDLGAGNNIYDFSIVRGHLLAEKENTDQKLNIYMNVNGQFCIKSTGYQLLFLRDEQGRVIGAVPTGRDYFGFRFHKLDASGSPLVEGPWAKGEPFSP